MKLLVIEWKSGVGLVANAGRRSLCKTWFTVSSRLWRIGCFVAEEQKLEGAVMIGVKYNIMVAANRTLVTVPYLIYLPDLLVVAWGCALCGVYCMLLRFTREASTGIGTWGRIAFSSVVALVCCLGSLVVFVPVDWCRHLPLRGLMVTFTVAVTVMLAKKRGHPGARFLAALFSSVVVTFLSLCLAGGSGIVASLSRNHLSIPVGIFCFFLFGCLVCTFAASTTAMDR